jgi:hypothetical protein
MHSSGKQRRWLTGRGIPVAEGLEERAHKVKHD